MKADLTAARPLAGRVVVVTRPREQAARFATLLEQAGARVMLVPTIRIVPPDSWEPLDDALAAAERYQWAVFTSANAVEMVRRRLHRAGRGSEALARCRIAAIGPATAEALATWGLTPEVVPEEHVAEALADRLRGWVRAGERVLLPRAAETRDVLVTELNAMGAVVDEIAAYRTRAVGDAGPELLAALAQRRVDAVTFTSSSTVRSFAALFSPDELPPMMAGVIVACIGPITAATVRELGLTVHVTPSEYTIPALARAITEHFEGQRS